MLSTSLEVSVEAPVVVPTLSKVKFQTATQVEGGWIQLPLRAVQPANHARPHACSVLQPR
jgi:hypothetical protein